MEKLALSRLQWRVVILGWVTYAAFYFGRVNLATALPAMQSDLRWLPAQTSALAGAALWTYAVGQLVNGWLGQYVDARRIVLIGMAGSFVINLLFAATSSLTVMIVLALVNGFLQSMGWGPILRTLGDTLAPKQRNRIAGAFGASYVVGNAITWVLTAWLLSMGTWRLTFIIPPLIMLGFGIAWYVLTVPAKPGAPVERSSVNLAGATAIIREFWPILVTSLVAGALYNGALIYAPTYVAQTLPINQAALTAIIFPIFGLLGTVWLSGRVMTRLRGNALTSLAVLLVLTALARGLAFVLPVSTWTSVILLASMGITSYALTNVLLTAVPLTTFSRLGTSKVAGMMDATHSIGGAIGSTAVGLLLARGGWPLVFAMWIVLPIAAVGMITVAVRSQSVRPVETPEEAV